MSRDRRCRAGGVGGRRVWARHAHGCGRVVTGGRRVGMLDAEAATTGSSARVHARHSGACAKQPAALDRRRGVYSRTVRIDQSFFFAAFRRHPATITQVPRLDAANRPVTPQPSRSSRSALPRQDSRATTMGHPVGMDARAPIPDFKCEGGAAICSRTYAMGARWYHAARSCGELASRDEHHSPADGATRPMSQPLGT